MKQSLFCVLSLLLIISVQCDKMCILNDYVCMTKGGQKIFKSLSEIDPLHLDEIRGTTENLKFKLNNLTMSGLTNCEVTFLTGNKVESSYEHHLTCPKLTITYIYEVIGKVNGFEIEGQSNGLLTANNYVIITYGKYEMNISKTDNIPHIYIKSFYIDTHPGSLKFESGKLLTAKGVDIAPQLTTLVNQNWRVYEKHMRDPLMTSFIGLLVSVFNKKFSTLTLTESFPDES